MAKNLKMKSARAALDMSQDALAKKIGVTRQPSIPWKMEITTLRSIYAYQYAERSAKRLTSFSGLRRKQNEHEKF